MANIVNKGEQVYVLTTDCLEFLYIVNLSF